MRGAVVGIGVIGSVHAQLLRERGELAAVCDIAAERCAAFPEAPAYSDYVTMLEEVRPDVVHICTPHYQHAEMATAALGRDINVLCEKPLGIGREDLARILEAERRSKAQLGVCLQNRYNAPVKAAKEYLKEARALGGMGLVAWHRDAVYYASGTWRGKKKTAGGGVLINQALHTLDLLMCLIGTPAYVTAKTANLTLKDEIEVEDTVAAVFSGGAEFSLFATNGSASEFETEIVIRTDRETLRILPDRLYIGGRCIGGGEARRYGKYCYGTGHAGIVDDFYACVKEGRKFPIDGKEGAKVVRLILAAYQSRGKRIEIEGVRE